VVLPAICPTLVVASSLMAYGIAINPTRICVEQTSVTSTPDHGSDIWEKSVEQPVV